MNFAVFCCCNSNKTSSTICHISSNYRGYQNYYNNNRKRIEFGRTDF